ncbi:MAG: EAL domain-containing protein [Azoarcus sp.]|jgi:EAL domain-containing protein (putative c-di-GMP-specific phosphodiesterase class I)|nr:EAL domain-containing protein [Azoarcus sp.]
MNAAPSPRDPPDGEAFVPDLSEGAEAGVYLALLELIDEGLIITGDEHIIDANSAACRLLERSYRQLAGQPLASLFADGRAFLDAREKMLIRGEARGILGLVLPDGRVQDFSYIVAPRLRPGIHAIVLDREARMDEAAAGLAPPPGCPLMLSLYFQPQIHVRSGNLHAGETLLRWQAAGEAPRPPMRLPAAPAMAGEIAPPRPEEEENARLDAWALAAVCRAASTWPHARGHAPVVSVNIAAAQMRGGQLPCHVATALASSRLDPRSLELSIDSHALALPDAAIASTLQALADMRVRLALDHFGHSPVPLAHLTRYRFDVLKLDAAFAGQVGRNDNDTALIEAIARMIAPLGIRMLARGVHSRAQQDFLLALGCELQQGPFIGAARDEHAFAGFLSERFFC